MSALKEVFSRVHFRYDNDPNAKDLEQFAAWLCAHRRQQEWPQDMTVTGFIR